MRRWEVHWFLWCLHDLINRNCVVVSQDILIKYVQMCLLLQTNREIPHIREITLQMF